MSRQAPTPQLCPPVKYFAFRLHLESSITQALWGTHARRGKAWASRRERGGVWRVQFVARGTFRGTRARHKHVSQIKGLLFGNSATCHPSSSSQGPGKQGFHALPQRSSGATCKLVGLISPKIKYVVGAISPEFEVWCEVAFGWYTQGGNTNA